MDSRAFDGLGDAIKFLFLICCISVPLGIWKAVDIVVWLFHHVSIHQ